MAKIAGRYEIRSKLGEGGMGVVFRAYDPAPVDREVAVKTLHELSDPLARELFYKECAALKSISHPNICEIFDIGEYDDGGHKRPFFVMPLLPGQTLDALIKNASHRLTVDRVVEIFAQTCRGLQAAHDHGLVHRDLKPSNIFVMSDDSVKIIDFGVAHAVHAHSQMSSYDKGTLLYMAPEQVQRKAVSAQSDIYSLGVTLYEALTRRQPFRHPTEDAIIHAITKQIPPPASELNPAVSQIVGRVVHKAMAKQPWNRFDSAREFGETLQKAARNESIALFDPSRTQPRIETATRALEKGDFQFADEIVTELEAEGNIEPQITLLRAQIDQIGRQKTVGQLLESARARFEEQEDPLALQKIQEVLQLDPTNVGALSLKSRIEDRRSERQIEKWTHLAQQHASNRSYGHAREALQNALALRPKDSRATRLLKEIDRDEQEYHRLRKEKAELYQAAVNAWQNGEVSQALSQMRLVLDLDRQAPDASSPETANTYQSFYNKIRSEHDVMNNAYAEARRCLAEKDFTKARQLCVDFLAKYPGQALFQALKYDIEEQQRQRLSSFIADVDRRLESEPDLEAKLSLVREAADEFPEEEHFRRLLRLHQDKRDLVNSIAERSRLHESAGQIAEALNDLETLATIYSAYPGLKFEKDRLKKRLEQQTRDGSRAKWVRQIDSRLQTGDYAGADELLGKAELEFKGDPEFVELRRIAAEGAERSKRADQLATDGLRLYELGQFDEAVDLLRSAIQLDDRGSVRMTLRDLLVNHAQQLFETDWRAADKLIDQVLELDPSHPLGKSLRARALDKQREQTVALAGSNARRLQADGKIDEALAEVERGLAANPGDSRLSVIADSLKKESARITPVPAPGQESRHPTAPTSRSAAPPVQPPPVVEPPPIVAPPLIANEAPIELPTVISTGRMRRDEDSDGSTRIINRDAVNDGIREEPRRFSPPAAPAARDAQNAPTPGPNRRGLWIGLAAVLVLFLGWYAFFSGGPTPPPPASQAFIILKDWPEGVQVLVDGESKGSVGPDRTFRAEIAPGSHQLSFQRKDFETATTNQEFAAGDNEVQTVSWRALASPPPLPPPDPGTSVPVTPAAPKPATLRLTGWTPGVRIVSGGRTLGTVGQDGSFTDATLTPGLSEFTFQRDRYENQGARIQLEEGKTHSVREREWRLTATNAPPPLPPPTTAELIINGWTSSARVLIDGRPATGTAQGGQYVIEVQPGSREVTLQRENFESQSRTVTFRAGEKTPINEERWRLTGPATVTIRFVAERTDVSVAVKGQDGRTIQTANTSGSTPVPLTEGKYTLTTLGPAKIPHDQNLTVTAGQNPEVHVQYAKGIESLDRAKWTDPSNGWYAARSEGMMWLDGVAAGGVVTFTSNVDSAYIQAPFARGKKLSWVVGWTDSSNYTSFELDHSDLIIKQLVGGTAQESRVAHHIDTTSVTGLIVEADLRSSEPVLRYRTVLRNVTSDVKTFGLGGFKFRPLPANGRFGLRAYDRNLRIKDVRFDPGK